MPGTLDALPAIEITGHRSSGLGSPDHPMRIMTRRAAGLVGEPWDDQARAEVAAYFDGLAPEWHTRTGPARDAVVADALDRGVGDRERRRVRGARERDRRVHAGARSTVAPRARHRGVARDAPAGPGDVGHRVLADGARLPLVDGAADAVVLVNCFLFPAEVDRVLAPDGVVVWVNSSGGETPIHLPPEDVIEALPGRWEGVQAGAGVGVWCTCCDRASLTLASP